MSGHTASHTCGNCKHFGTRGVEPIPTHIYPCHLPADRIVLPPSIRPEALGAYHRNFMLPTDGELCPYFEVQTEQLKVPMRRTHRARIQEMVAS